MTNECPEFEVSLLSWATWLVELLTVDFFVT